MFRMSCPTARTLFEIYSYATMEHSEATGKLSTLVGRHEEFAEAKKHCDEMSAKCRTARRVFEQDAGKNMDVALANPAQTAVKTFRNLCAERGLRISLAYARPVCFFFRAIF